VASFLGPVCSKASYLAKDGVLVLKFHGRVQCDKELTFVVIRYTRVGHGDKTATNKPQSRVKLVRKGFSILVTRFASQPSTLGVATLDDKAGDDTMKDSIVIVALHAKLYKVPTGLGSLLGPEFYGDITMACVEVHLSSIERRTLEVMLVTLWISARQRTRCRG